jgi:hypothetical protein
MSAGRDCQHIQTCAMYTLFRNAGTLKTWQMRFCSAEFRTCERYKRSAQGRPVPINLLPNGEMMRHLSSPAASAETTPPKTGAR